GGAVLEPKGGGGVGSAGGVGPDEVSQVAGAGRAGDGKREVCDLYLTGVGVDDGIGSNGRPCAGEEFPGTGAAGGADVEVAIAVEILHRSVGVGGAVKRCNDTVVANVSLKKSHADEGTA